MKRKIILSAITLLFILGFTRLNDRTAWGREDTLADWPVQQENLVPKTEKQPPATSGYTGISADQANKLAKHYMDRNKDLCYYMGDSLAKSDSLWSKDDLLKMLHEDAGAVWHSAESLQSYINAVKDRIASQNCGNLNLGFRIYFGRYTNTTPDIPKSYVNRQTIFLVPTYDSISTGKDGMPGYLPIDFNPWSLSGYGCNQLVALDTNGNIQEPSGMAPALKAAPQQKGGVHASDNAIGASLPNRPGIWVMQLNQSGTAVPPNNGNWQYRLDRFAKVPLDSAMPYIMNHSQIPPTGKPGGMSFYQH